MGRAKTPALPPPVQLTLRQLGPEDWRVSCSPRVKTARGRGEPTVWMTKEGALASGMREIRRLIEAAWATFPAADVEFTLAVSVEAMKEERK